MVRGLQSWLVPLIAAGLLGGMTADARFLRTAPADAEPYHLRVKQAVEAVSYRIGDWIGEDVKVPVEAVAMLHPNVILSRRYRNSVSGFDVTMLLVHCRDARDLEGHYPRNCYPANGMTLSREQPCDWKLSGMGAPITGTEYQFDSQALHESSGVIVDNFMLLPNGQIARDMDGVIAVAKNRALRHFGAGQVQLVFDQSVPPSVRQEAFQTLIGANVPLWEAIRVGAQTSKPLATVNSL